MPTEPPPKPTRRGGALLLWEQDEKHFQRRIGTGREREAYVAYRLIAEGLEVSVPRLRVRPSFAERHAYRDTRDMIVEGHEIEIKSTRFAFTDPGEFPYNPCFVDTEEKILAKGPPFAFLIVSQQTGAIMAVPGKTRDRWVVMEGRDHERGIGVRWLGCPIHLVRTFDEFVRHLESAHHELDQPGEGSDRHSKD
ncbi:MAG: hypothetical protein CMN10_02050 [Roseobacter sp.]|nr:hypothetical protein [Roseobacter sp.]